VPASPSISEVAALLGERSRGDMLLALKIAFSPNFDVFTIARTVSARDINRSDARMGIDLLLEFLRASRQLRYQLGSQRIICR
jgi:hypothetical protein